MMGTLLKAEGTVTPSCSKSHITYTVHLNRKYREIHVEFTYEPKKLADETKARELIYEGFQQYIQEEHRKAFEDNWQDFLPLQNLLTLSFDDENGFRGAGHRQDPIQHLIISEKTASPGLVPGVFPRGQLRIMINLHCVVSEECRYRLHVWEGGEAE